MITKGDVDSAGNDDACVVIHLRMESTVELDTHMEMNTTSSNAAFFTRTKEKRPDGWGRPPGRFQNAGLGMGVGPSLSSDTSPSETSEKAPRSAERKNGPETNCKNNQDGVNRLVHEAPRPTL